MATPLLPPGKYQLRSLHEEIALFDRKLSHLQNHETFSTQSERETAIEKLTAKRSLLVRKAQQMIDSGVEVTYTPRPNVPNSIEHIASMKQQADVQPEASSSKEMAPTETFSPFAGTSLDFRLEVEAYKASRSRRRSA